MVHQRAWLTQTLAKSVSDSFSMQVCERGLSKQNLIKSHMWASLKLGTLDVLIHMSFVDILIDGINQEDVILL